MKENLYKYTGEDTETYSPNEEFILEGFDRFGDPIITSLDANRGDTITINKEEFEFHFIRENKDVNSH